MGHGPDRVLRGLRRIPRTDAVRKTRSRSPQALQTGIGASRSADRPAVQPPQDKKVRSQRLPAVLSRRMTISPRPFAGFSRGDLLRPGSGCVLALWKSMATDSPPPPVVRSLFHSRKRVLFPWTRTLRLAISRDGKRIVYATETPSSPNGHNMERFRGGTEKAASLFFRLMESGSRFSRAGNGRRCPWVGELPPMCDVGGSGASVGG